MEERGWIAGVSRWFVHAFVMIGIGILGALLLYWAQVGPSTATTHWLSGATTITLSLPLRCLAFAVTLLPAMAAIAGLFYLRRLFQLYAVGSIFGAANVAAIRGLAASCVAFTVADLTFRPLLAMVLTMNNPAGERFITLALSSGGVMGMVFGGVLWVFVRVMDEARKIDEEQAWTV